MGSLCSCFRAPEPDDESVDSDDIAQVQESSGVVSRNAPTNFASFLQDLTNKAAFVTQDGIGPDKLSRAIFIDEDEEGIHVFFITETSRCEAVLGRRGNETVPWPYQGPSSSQPTIAQSSSSGSSSSGSGISFMRHEKGSNYSRGQPVNVRSTPNEEGTNKGHRETPLMVASDKVKTKVNTISVDDEDVCPICLEEYTSENPRIVTKCSHHYHLSCIYEWNERSKTCPVCSKLMVFEEMA